MTVARTAATASGLALVLALTGCGIQPTGVMSGAEPATGLTQDLRIYFVRDTRLQGVSRPGRPIGDLNAAIKLLIASLSPDEQQRGLANLVQSHTYEATGTGNQVTLHAPDAAFDTDRNRLATGQLVCTLARAQAFLDRTHKIRPDDVQVTLDDSTQQAGPYQCSQFLGS